jgi:hypothetical protein
VSLTHQPTDTPFFLPSFHQTPHDSISLGLQPLDHDLHTTLAVILVHDRLMLIDDERNGFEQRGEVRDVVVRRGRYGRKRSLGVSMDRRLPTRISNSRLPPLALRPLTRLTTKSPYIARPSSYRHRPIRSASGNRFP